MDKHKFVKNDQPWREIECGGDPMRLIFILEMAQG